jgi:hypothetical protein
MAWLVAAVPFVVGGVVMCVALFRAEPVDIPKIIASWSRRRFR